MIRRAWPVVQGLCREAGCEVDVLQVGLRLRRLRMFRSEMAQ
jgi:hypothetical protein